MTTKAEQFLYAGYTRPQEMEFKVVREQIHQVTHHARENSFCKCECGKYVRWRSTTRDYKCYYCKRVYRREELLQKIDNK